MKKNLLTLLALAALTSATVAQVPSYVPSNGLVGWWPFNGNANDESGNGNDGTVNGATLTTDRFGNANAAYDFDGTSDFIDVTYQQIPDFSNGITLQAWVLVDGNNSNYPCPNQSNQNCAMMFISSSGDWVASHYSLSINQWNYYVGGNLAGVGVGSVQSTSTPYTIPFTSFIHVVYTFDNSTTSLYIDGVLSNALSYSTPLPSPLHNRLKIGNHDQSPSWPYFTNGKLDDIGIWNRALTPCEIQQLYTSQVITPPTATITPQGSTAICSGGFVQLVASAGDSYLWSNGATSQSITVTQAGQYSVTVTNNDGCTDTSTPTTVSVNPTPSSGVTVGGATTFCTGSSVTLTAQGTGSYLWSNGATSQSITVTQGGNYSVTVTNNGCSATSGVTTVTVNPTPTASIAPQGSTTFCQGGFVVLQASGGGSYQWNTGAQSSSINVSQSGTYTVVVTDNGCTAQAQQQVTVNPLPSVSLQPIAALCANASAVALTGGSPAGGSYTVNGTPATTLNPAQTGSGQQTVAYTFTNGNGCSNTATQSATVNAVPSVSLSGLNTAYLPTDAPVQLSGSPAGGVFNGTGVSNGQFDPAAAGLGTHSVQYVVVGANGCVGSSGLCTTVDLTTGSGIGLDNGGNGVEVYPNPSNGLFTVVMDGMDGIVQLSVMDIRGREVASQSLTARGRTTHSIDLSGFASGVYTLRIQSAKGTSGIKLVKE